MPNRTHTDVLHAAEQAITAAMQDGQHKYDAGNWLKRSIEDHLEHAAAHFEELLGGPDELNKDEARTALSHAITRLALAWARRKNE